MRVQGWIRAIINKSIEINTEREREREREREKQRQRQRQRQRQTDRQTETDRQAETGRQREREREKQRQRQIDSDRQTDRQTETDRQTDRQRDLLLERRTDWLNSFLHFSIFFSAYGRVRSGSSSFTAVKSCWVSVLRTEKPKNCHKMRDEMASDKYGTTICHQVKIFNPLCLCCDTNE